VAGSSLSSSVGFVLADVPTAPTVAPTSDKTVSTGSKLKIDYNTVTATGGSPLLTYSLEIDDGQGGDFVPLYGIVSNTLTTTYTITNGIQRGLTYRARYRVRNAVGWSGYSPICYLLAAVKPSAPPAPIFVSADQTTITLQFERSADNGGSPITKYELWRDDGLNGPLGLEGYYDLMSTSYVVD
jgi:hypothetical protein